LTPGPGYSPGAMRIISIIGRPSAGKTTLLVALAREFNRRGKRVATIKEAVAPADPDREGSDVWRHYHEGLAEGVLVAAPGGLALFERRSDPADPEALARACFGDRDLVLVEGFEKSSLPRIEIFRSSLGPEPLVTSAPDPGLWVALLTDVLVTGYSFPVLRFTDTMWLQLLASLAWDRAKPLDS